MQDVRWIHTRLWELGFDPGKIDGVRGPNTDAAIVEFKRSIGFQPRSYVGPLTLAALQGIPDKERATIPWMAEAARMRGIHEVRDAAKLRKWFDPLVSWFEPEDVPWCGAFVLTCYRMWDSGQIAPANPLGARSWSQFGKSCTPRFGACMVFWRGSKSGWQGHVGFYYAEDATHYHILGGNQSDSVSISRIAKERLLSSRWPSNYDVIGKPILVSPDGVPVTTNEA